jgi:hypothetical protein
MTTRTPHTRCHTFRIKHGTQQLTAIAPHQAQAATIGEQVWGEQAPVQIVRLSAAKERPMSDDQPTTPHQAPHISLVDLHRPVADKRAAAANQAQAKAPTHTLAELQAEAYQRGVLDGRDGNLSTLALGIVLGLAAGLILIGAFPDLISWISPTARYTV